VWNHFFQNRAYIGEYEFMGKTYTNIYPAIISKELFDAVQKQIQKKSKTLTSRKNHPRRKRSGFFLANVSMCTYCGGNVEGKSVKGNRYYVCSSHNTKTDLCPEAPLIPANDLETEVITTLIHHVLTEPYLQELLDWTNKTLNNGVEDLMLQVAGVRAKLQEEERIVNRMAYNFGTMEKASQFAEKLLHDKEELVLAMRGELAGLEFEIENRRITATIDQIAAFVERSRELIDQGEMYDLRLVVEQLCSRIVIGNDVVGVEIMFPL
jgi:hypothetical protein